MENEKKTNKVKSAPNYDFAFNKIKLARAIARVRARNEEVSEENVKTEYVSIGGLLAADEEKLHEVILPKVTGNGNQKITSK